MGIGYRIIDFNERFSCLSKPPIIINHMDVVSKEGKKKLNDLLYSQYEGDILDVPPSCDCGETHGEHMVGVTCSNCDTEVFPHTEKPLESNVWLEVPECVTAFIGPVVWNILSNHLTVNSINIAKWFCITTYRPADKDHRVIQRLTSITKQLGIQRGFNAFHDNFDRILDALHQHRLIKDHAMLFAFVEKHRDRIFCQYLPIPSRLCFVTEKNGSAIYTNTAMKPAIDAVRTITSIYNAPRTPSPATMENRAATAVCQLASMYPPVVGRDLAPKEGWYRRHIYGSRSHFSFRAVISSISGPHDYEDAHLPWGLAITVFKLHIASKLLRRGYTPNEAYREIYESIGRYNPHIHEILEELIAESPDGRGIPCIIQRNPTLNRGSAQRFFITKVKTDPSIITISISVLVLNASNADFDGDEMNGLIALDYQMAMAFERLAPHHGVLELSTPRETSGHISLPAQVLQTALNWIR